MSGPPSTSSTDTTPPPGWLEVGRIVRAHGIRGEVIVAPVSNRPERFVPGSVLVSRAGRRFVLTAGRPHQDRWIVALDGVADRNGAEALRGTDLYGEPLGPLGDEEYWVHEVIGRSVVDVAGTPIGTVAAIEANPASDLLVLDDGRLIPVVFVRDMGGPAIVIDAPAGLLDG